MSAINIDVYLKYYKRRPKSGETLEQIDAEFEQPVGIGDEVTVWVKQQRTLKLTQEADLKVMLGFDLRGLCEFENLRRFDGLLAHITTEVNLS